MNLFLKKKTITKYNTKPKTNEHDSKGMKSIPRKGMSRTNEIVEEKCIKADRVPTEIFVNWRYLDTCCTWRLL